MKPLTLEDALGVFGRAASATIRPRAAILHLSFTNPMHRATVRRKANETFADMLIRCASKAVENQANDVKPAAPVRCKLCGQLAKKTTKLCYRCEHTLPVDPHKAEQQRLKRMFDEYSGPLQ